MKAVALTKDNGQAKDKDWDDCFHSHKFMIYNTQKPHKHHQYNIHEGNVDDAAQAAAEFN
jgi:hypothetical protein